MAYEFFRCQLEHETELFQKKKKKKKEKHTIEENVLSWANWATAARAESIQEPQLTCNKKAESLLAIQRH